MKLLKYFARDSCEVRAHAVLTTWRMDIATFSVETMLQFISFSTDEFAATIAVDGITVLREIAKDGKLSSFDFLERTTKTLVLIYVAILESCKLKWKSDIEYFVNMREKTLAIGHWFAKFTNVFSRQRFPLYGIWNLRPWQKLHQVSSRKVPFRPIQTIATELTFTIWFN